MVSNIKFDRLVVISEARTCGEFKPTCSDICSDICSTLYHPKH